MKPLAELIAELIAEIIRAERQRALQDAVAQMVREQDCALTGWVSFDDYDPCCSELFTEEKMN